MIDSDSAERTRLSAQAVAVAERRRSAAEVWARLVSSPTTIVGLCLIGLLIGMAIFGPWIAPYPEDADSVNFSIAFEPPSRAHLFGTDEAGRDVLSRIILGSRISLTVGVLVLVIAVGVGVPVGLVAGYKGGATQATLMRISDVFLSFPSAGSCPSGERIPTAKYFYIGDGDLNSLVAVVCTTYRRSYAIT